VVASPSLAPQIITPSEAAATVVVTAEKLRFEAVIPVEPVDVIETVDVSEEETILEEGVSKWDWNYSDAIDEKLLEFDYEQGIPNANFIYHNKLPKSGSTTMHDILRYVKYKNII